MNNRLAHNLSILAMLKTYLEMYPDMRFGQALVNMDVLVSGTSTDLGVVQDPFYDESSVIRDRMIAYMSKMVEE
jgi:hypothetical protein